jgi:hypothetical protein
MLSSGGAAGAVAGLAGHVVTGEIVDGGRDGNAVGGHLPAIWDMASKLVDEGIRLRRSGNRWQVMSISETGHLALGLRTG